MDPVPCSPVRDRLSIEKLTEYPKSKPHTVAEKIKRHNTPAHRIGRHWKCKREDVDERVRSGAARDLSG